MKVRAGTKILCIPLVTLMILSCKNTELIADTNRPAHHTEDGFQNLYIEPNSKGPFTYVMMKYFGDDPFADQELQAHTVPIAQPSLDLIQKPKAKPQVTWLGHSTFLIQYKGINILTDPILSSRASPVSFAGPKRLIDMPIRFENLPPIDYVVISHNHYDHLDAPSIEFLGNTPFYLVPLKLKPWFLDEGVDTERIREFDWWDSFTIDDLKVSATPSQHWSARGLFDRYKTLWVSWHLEIEDFSIWFAGDIGYNNIQYKEIGAKFPDIDIALIPIGAYSPRWFMKPSHVDPEQAVLVHNDVGSKLSIGMHWGTFQLSAEPILEPSQRLKKAVDEGGLAAGDFITLAVGETYHYDAKTTAKNLSKHTGAINGVEEQALLGNR